MKPPTELARRWARQWAMADLRQQRLLSAGAWPVSLSIGKPSPNQFLREIDRVREHVRVWRAITTGRVDWEHVNFRSGGEPVEVPVRWVLNNPSEWVAACEDSAIQREFQRLGRLVQSVDSFCHRALVRQKSLLEGKSEQEIIKAVEVVLELSPGSARRRPLRAFSLCGIDSKFFERHRALLVHLLDLRFDGEVSEVGLESFLDALDEGEHWLLLAPLEPGLLLFSQQRVRAREVRSTALAASHVVIVENERCVHQLPQLTDTVAILGSGFNLEWMDAQWLSAKRLAYWGDIDTWGLVILARARIRQVHVEPLLMSREVFDALASTMAVEDHCAGDQPPEALTASEKDLYRHLCGQVRGRLEQEFIPRDQVVTAMEQWRATGRPGSRY